jgi:hypothetical protein
MSSPRSREDNLIQKLHDDYFAGYRSVCEILPESRWLNKDDVGPKEKGSAAMGGFPSPGRSKSSKAHSAYLVYESSETSS